MTYDCYPKVKAGRIFVFGSNDQGRHGAGAALEARKKHGAIYGIGSGMQGNSYGIVTKYQVANSRLLCPLPLNKVAEEVEKFIRFAKPSDREFHVTKVGSGLARNSESDMAGLFRTASSNCFFHPDWERFGLKTYGW